MTEYARPTYQEELTRIEADLNAVPAVLREPLSAAWARACHGLHGHLEWVDRQCSPLTCELERLYDWAALYQVERLAATFSSGPALATGNIGTIILADTLLRGQNGLDYTVVAAVTLGAGSTPVQLRCTTSGIAGNLIAGQTLTLVDPIPGCNSTMTVDAAGITGGAADELVDDWRVRVADEWQYARTYGARSGRPEDYRFWAKSAHPSVSTALVYKHLLGIGTVLVYPICNGLTNRLPSAAVIAAVEDYLELVAPATADWRVIVATPHYVNPNIHLLPGYDTTPNRNAISAALSTTVLAEASETSLLAVAEIDVAIATVTSQYTRVAPTVDIGVTTGEVLVLNPVTWS